MGVHGLWELLAPVGRRVSVETLAGKRLAIDASIWMIQFMKAMRDEKGEMIRNAHILGFFRRICKLLFLRTKPVFVFDGGTPALKRRTVIARRRQRENAQAKIRKTAEKLLLNHLKATRLKELAKDLESQRQLNDSKGKRIISDQSPVTENNSQAAEDVLGSYNQESLDEMLAASIAAEENQSFTGDASTSAATNILDDDEDDEDEEIILPTMHGKIDPAVLASLPPSMQLDLLVQMRERLMAENRQKYQKVKKAPARFSELQIQSYLKTVAFRREIGEVQKSAAGRGIGGMQTSRIASEANREFIFSSTFTGDKQALTSAGLEKRNNDQNQTPKVLPSAVSLGEFVSSSKSKSNADVDEPNDGFSVDVETYLDENGRVRVSRNRAMGLRMTRDLQRNLDLMKESEVVLGTNENVATEAAIKESESSKKSSIEVCIEDLDEGKKSDSDDDLFARLVTDDSATVSKNHSSDSFSDCEWEEGSVAGINNVNILDVSEEDDIEWEEETFEIPQHTSHCPPESHKPISKGVQEEEFEFQEAIRLSLVDLKDEKLVQEKEQVKESASFVSSDHQENTSVEPKSPSQNVLETHISPIVTNICETLGTESASSVQVYPERSSGVKTAILSTEVHIEPATQENVVDINENSLDPVELAEKSEFETVSDYNWTGERDEPSETLVKESKRDLDPVEKASDDLYKGSPNDYSALIDSEKEQEVEYTEASLEDEMMILDKERTNLNDEQRKLERNAESVSGEMFAECQELLQMFGLPYIIAPMEAEAQCAYMELTNLVDGVVTDDSDVFLFGARSVYKNIFDDRKYVETYFMKDVETELGITREKLIRMAMLLGSDYTEGVSGIGIVNAVEVVNAFPEEDGLKKFREWIESPDPSILGKADLQSGSPAKKKGSKVNKEVASLSDGIDNVTQIFMNKHRNVSKNWHIPMTFPSDAVITAYTAPQVDRSTESFSWGKPDQVVLRKLCWEKFGWGTQKADELLGPVLKEYNKRETQLRLEAFYSFNERFAKIRSKRIKKAVKCISGNKCSELMDDSVEKDTQSRKKAKLTQNPTNGENTNSTVKSPSKPPRKKRNLTQKTVGKKKKQNLDFENDEASSDSEQEAQAEKDDVPHTVRRSTRPRKAAKYTSNDMEIDEDDVSHQMETSNPICVDSLNDAVEPGLGQNEEPVHEAGPSQEYLQMGGGFCLDDDDQDKELNKFDDSNITANSSANVQESELGIYQNLDHQNEEYLKMGGGFCLDDDDEDKELNKFDNSNITLNSSAKVQDSELGIIDQNLDHQNVTTYENLSNLDASEKIMEEDELRTRSQTSLKAMPFLRRKRKKN